MGVPDVWNELVPHDDLINTKALETYLIPTLPKDTPKVRGLGISRPFNASHELHVDFNGSGNFSLVGTPSGWFEKFTNSGININFINPVKPRLSTERRSKSVLLVRSASKNNALLRQEGISDENWVTTKPSLLDKALFDGARSLHEVDGLEEEPLKNISPIDNFYLRPYIIDADLDPNSRFCDLKLIAEGESGNISRAMDCFSGKTVAIKKVAWDKHVKLRTLRTELYLMSTTNHPNLISYHGCYTSVESLWIIMELMDLGSLVDIISCYPEFKMKESHISRVASDVLSALEYLEAHAIAHRDVMSDNLLVNSRGNIKLADFGKSIILSKRRPTRYSIVGTLYWIAPEMIRKEVYTPKVDIWGLGIVLFEMAEGVPPNMDDPEQARQDLLNGCQPRLASPELWSPCFKHFLTSCTLPNPEERPAAEALSKHDFLSQKCHPLEMVKIYQHCAKLTSDPSDNLPSSPLL